MGTIKSNTSGIELRKGIKTESIRIKFMYRGMECRESLKLAHTKANIKFAERLRGEILNAIQLKTFDYSKYFPDSRQLGKFGLKPRQQHATIGDYLRMQIAIYERTLAPSSLDNYKRYIKNHLMPKWENTRLTEIVPADLRAWIVSLGLKARTTKQIMIPLRGALDLAIHDELIQHNPLDRVKLKKVLDRDSYKVDSHPDPFNTHEIEALLAACDGQIRNVFQFAFYTGMRPSEYMALRWDSIDWIEKKIRVERSRVAGKTRDELKTESSRRMVDIRSGALEALQAQRKYSELKGGVIFRDPATGEGWGSTGRLSIHWIALVKKAKVRYRRPYQTRHTFASTLLSCNENQLYVANQMGHKDTTMLNRHYSKWIEQDDVLPNAYERVTGFKKSKNA